MTTGTYVEQSKPLHERWRDRISKAKILERVIKYIDGELDMTNGQLTASLKIIDKMMPNLKHIEHSGMIEHHQMSIHDLNARLSALGHNPDEVWNQLNDNRIIDIRPEPVEQLEPSELPVDNPVENIEPDQD